MTALHIQAEIQQLLRKEKNFTVLEAIRMRVPLPLWV